MDLKETILSLTNRYLKAKREFKQVIQKEHKDITTLDKAFVTGVAWADKHPESPFRKIKDKKPDYGNLCFLYGGNGYYELVRYYEDEDGTPIWTAPYDMSIELNEVSDEDIYIKAPDPLDYM